MKSFQNYGKFLCVDQINSDINFDLDMLYNDIKVRNVSSLTLTIAANSASNSVGFGSIHVLRGFLADSDIPIKVNGKVADLDGDGFDYDTGTISLTENDKTVIGSGTTFTGNIAADDVLYIQEAVSVGGNGGYYVVDSITNATTLELKDFPLGITETGLAYGAKTPAASAQLFQGKRMLGFFGAVTELTIDSLETAGGSDATVKVALFG